MRIAGAARGVYALSPMRIAFGGRPFYAHSRGVEGVAPEGAVPRWYRPPTFESSFLFLPAARPTDSRPRTRPRRSEGRRILGCPLLSAPGDGTGRPGRRRGSVRIEEHLATRPDSGLHPATSPVVLLA